MTDKKLERVVTGRPVDGTASRVTSVGPKGYELGKKILQLCSPTPLLTIPVPACLIDVTGKKRGRLTVIGFIGRKRWLCRCACGYYTNRSTRSILNEKNSHDECDRCRHVTHLRRQSHYRQTGQDPED